MPPNLAIDSRTCGKTMHQILPTKQTGQIILQTNNFGMPQHSYNDAYHSQRPYETPVSPHVYVNQQPPNLTPFNFN